MHLGKRLLNAWKMGYLITDKLNDLIKQFINTNLLHMSTVVRTDGVIIVT
jgi:hypothetical protein